MKYALAILAFLVGLTLVAGADEPESPQVTLSTDAGSRPNILYLYVDDMGWGSIGPNGQASRRAAGLPTVRTPNLDQLAAQGVNFTRGYGCHVCSPARSSQQTGFHQGHTFADRNDPNNAKKAIRADDVTMGDALAAAGYVTGYWGKWGYGGSKSQIDPVIENEQTLPTSHGYRHVLAELHHVRAHTFFQPTLWSAPAESNAVGSVQLVPNSIARTRGDARYPDSPALQNHPDYPPVAYCDDSYAFAALDFVREQGQNYRRTGQPFFGLLAVQVPHAPFGEIESLPEWDSAYRDDPHFASLSKQSRQWAAMVTRIDAHFGNLLDALQDPNGDGDTADSIAGETLVVFQSDNGGPSGDNNRQLDANGGLKGNKGKIQEGGIRVPLVMRWPDKITDQSLLAAGSHCDLVVDVTDLLPTFCDLAGTPAPLGIDGISIAPTLRGQGHQRRRDFIIHEAGNGQSIIRGDHKLVRSGKSRYQLFDLHADPGEENDLSEDSPEIVKELASLLIGERVTEPRGFANTYHHWIGGDGAAASDPAHWSDYEYANRGITYQSDNGPPQLSWTARMVNRDNRPRTAVAEESLQFLALEVAGDTSNSGSQTLKLKPGADLTGRNAIRLAGGSRLIIDGSSVRSLRWVDIEPNATLQGHGVVQANVENGGTIQVNGDVATGNARPDSALRIEGQFRQSGGAVLELPLSEATSSLVIDGEASLAGELRISLPEGFRPKSGETFRLITANRLRGEFEHASGRIVAAGGVRFVVGYDETGVTLTVE